jgi:hypothetical protein
VSTPHQIFNLIQKLLRIFFTENILPRKKLLLLNLPSVSSDESEVSLNNEDNGSDLAPWKASQSPEPCSENKEDIKTELLKSTLNENTGKKMKSGSRS